MSAYLSLEIYYALTSWHRSGHVAPCLHVITHMDLDMSPCLHIITHTDMEMTPCPHIISHMDMNMTPCLSICHFKFIIPY